MILWKEWMKMTPEERLMFTHEWVRRLPKNSYPTPNQEQIENMVEKYFYLSE